MQVTTEEQAEQRLFAWQRANGYIETQPARGDTEETEAGWAFFNIHGYLGTVTPSGEVVDDPAFAEVE